MPESLIDSQFEALEAPVGALVVDTQQPIHAIVTTIVRDLALARVNPRSMF